MAKKHCIHIVQSDLYHKPTYIQNNVLDIGDIIEVTFEGYEGMANKIVVVKERTISKPYNTCDKCPFRIEKDKWGPLFGCTARRKTGEGMRTICQKDIGGRIVFEFTNLDNILEDL